MVSKQIGRAVRVSLILSALLFVVSCSSSSSTKTKTSASSQSISGTIYIPSGSNVDKDVQTSPTTFIVKNNDTATAQRIDNPTVLGGYISGDNGFYSDLSSYSEDTSDIFEVSLLQNQTISLNVFHADPDLTANTSVGFRLYRTSDTLTKTGEQLFSGQGSKSIQVPESDDYYIVISADSVSSPPILYTLIISQGVSGSAGTEALVNPNADFVPGEVIVKYKTSSVSALSALPALSTQQASEQIKLDTKLDMGKHGVLKRFDKQLMASGKIGGISISSRSSMPENYRKKWRTAELINKLRQQPDIEYAEPNYRRRAAYTPTDTHYTKQWNYPLINLPAAWEVAKGDNTVVAVIDTGIAGSHQDLNANISLTDGWDFISDIASAGDSDGADSDPEDPEGAFHGSHVAGIVAAVEGNSRGIVGVAFNATIMPLRVLGVDGFGVDTEIAQAILYAAQLPNSSGQLPLKKADIINLSLGSEPFSSALKSAVNAALAEGVIIVAAAGNNSSSTPFYPAALDGVVSVSAVSENKTLASFSNYGNTIDVAAPGGSGANDLNNDHFQDGILSTIYASEYAELQGTSMAAPHVAGVAALMKSIDPNMDNIKFMTGLTGGHLTDNIGSSSSFGYGLINAAKAMTWLEQSVPSLLSVFPANFSFTSESTTSSLTLSNPGTGTITIESLSVDASWLTVTENEVDSNLLGTYTVEVDRSGLELNTNHSAEISISYRIDGGSLQTEVLDVFLSVPSSYLDSTVGAVYVTLVKKSDQDDAEANGELFVDIFATAYPSYSNGEYRFQFSNIPPGEYILDASTDNDYDSIVNDAGEAVGSYPVLGDSAVITVSNSDIDNINFSMSYQSFSSSSDTAKNDRNSARKLHRLPADRANETQSPKRLLKRQSDR